jgi:hypothetical protein
MERLSNCIMPAPQGASAGRQQSLKYHVFYGISNEIDVQILLFIRESCYVRLPSGALPVRLPPRKGQAACRSRREAILTERYLSMAAGLRFLNLCTTDDFG